MANALAGREVVPLYRSTGQAQFAEAFVPDLDDRRDLADLLHWA